MNEEDRQFGGMTLVERVVVAGLLQQFDAAVDSGDRERGIQVLLQTTMSRAAAAETVDAVLANPTKYGYPRQT